MSNPQHDGGSEHLEKLLEILPSFALLAGLRLDVFGQLEAGPLTTDELAQTLNADKRRLSELLYALTTIELLDVLESSHEQRFANSKKSSRYLVPGKPDFIAGHQELLALVWEAALNSADSIREGRPLAEKDFSSMPPQELAAFLGGLHSDALARGRELAATEWLCDCNHVVDIGGGSGGLAIGLAEELPSVQVTIVELARVAAITREFVARSPAANRIDIVATDLAAEKPDPHVLLWQSYHAVAMVSFVQVLSPAQAERAIARAFALLQPGGLLYIIGIGILDNNRVTPAGGSLFNLIFHNIYDSGRSYTLSEHQDWLDRAGFENQQLLELGDGTRVICATKPKP